MPSTMLHILTAYKVNPNASDLFWIGTIAPDAFISWKEKDKNHFRHLEDRESKLRTLSKSIDNENSFDEGVLLHLYLDWKWDLGPQRELRREHKGDWFNLYEKEMISSSIWLFHNKSWCKRIWLEMLDCEENKYGTIDGLVSNDIKEYIKRIFEYHVQHRSDVPSIFTPGLIETFTDFVAQEYLTWRKIN
jgi:hypothetical protein